LSALSLEIFPQRIDVYEETIAGVNARTNSLRHKTTNKRFWNFKVMRNLSDCLEQKKHLPLYCCFATCKNFKIEVSQG